MVRLIIAAGVGFLKDFVTMFRCDGRTYLWASYFDDSDNNMFIVAEPRLVKALDN